MKHLYDDGEGEIYAADSIDQADRYLRELIGKDYDPKDYHWSQVPDDHVFEEKQEDGKTVVKKTAAVFAAECERPAQVWTTYN